MEEPSLAHNRCSTHLLLKEYIAGFCLSGIRGRGLPTLPSTFQALSAQAQDFLREKERLGGAGGWPGTGRGLMRVLQRKRLADPAGLVLFMVLGLGDWRVSDNGGFYLELACFEKGLVPLKQTKLDANCILSHTRGAGWAPCCGFQAFPCHFPPSTGHSANYA